MTRSAQTPAVADRSFSFDGFSAETWAFLDGLAADNSKAYFEANRSLYDEQVRAPLGSLVVSLGDRLRSLDPGIDFEAKVGRSLFRINRDLRFSTDPTPYRTHLDAIFWHGESPRTSPACILRIASDHVVVGVGVGGVRTERLARYRDAVAGPAGADLVASIGAAIDAVPGASLSEPSRVRVPKPFDADHERADLLRRDGFHLSAQLPRPAEIDDAGFVDWCVARYEPLTPVLTWLVAHVGDE